ENSPAAQKGLRFGDRIDAVDGVSMHAKQSAEVRDKIRGPLGSHVKLTITHANSGKTDIIEIVRNKVPQPSVPDAYMIRPGVRSENSPAAQKGLRFGDRIDAVDGVSMHAKQSAEVRDKIRGPLGSHVKLTITHANSGKTDIIEIVRNKVPQPSVPDAYMIRPGV